MGSELVLLGAGDSLFGQLGPDFRFSPDGKALVATTAEGTVRSWSATTGKALASLAPKAEITVYPWKEPPELKERTIDRVRTFLKARQPTTAMR